MIHQMLKMLGKSAWHSAKGALSITNAAYRGGPITRAAMGAVGGGVVGAIAEDGGMEARLAGAARGASMGAAAGALTSALRPMMRTAWSMRPGVRDVARTAWTTTTSFGRLMTNHPGPTMLTVGAAGVALAAAPMAIDVKASMDQQKYQQTLMKSYSTEAAMLGSMQTAMVHPSPGTGPSPSLNSRFMNSTAGLVQGLHANRAS